MSFASQLEHISLKHFDSVVNFIVISAENHKDFKEILDGASNIHEKLAVTESTLEKYNLFGSLDTALKSTKNEEISVKYRTKGNEFYIKKDYTAAMSLYEDSLSFAKPDGLNILLSYSNRSAALYKLGNYEGCLEAINLAQDYSQIEKPPPPSFLHKLNDRKRLCYDNLNKRGKEEKELEFKLSYPRHKKSPYIANCLEIKTSIRNQIEDNYIYASHSLNAGDVLSVEPYFSRHSPSNDTINCCYCFYTFKKFPQMISCKNCIYANYCSLECRSNDWNGSHKYLCSVYGKLKGIPPKLYHSVKIALHGIDIFKNITELNTYCANNSINNDGEEFNEKDYYKLFHNYANSDENIDQKVCMNNLIFLTYLVLVKRCLFKFTEIKFENNNEEKLFINIIIQYFNNYKRFIQPQNNGYEEIVGTRIMVSGSISCLYSHSCSPNVAQFIGGGHIITVALRPIKANEALTKTHIGIKYYEVEKPMRQKMLKDNFGFTCECEACQNNYGLASTFPDDLSLPPLGFTEIMSIRVRYMRLISYLQHHNMSCPCKQLVIANVWLQYIFCGYFFGVK